jgi:hypothetical protein
MVNNKKNKQNKQNKQNKPNKQLPFVSICTPTFNRRPFLPFIIKCFENQTYPKDRVEWIIIDDGTDKVEDLFKNVPQVKYFKYDNQMVLGKKRNIANSKCKGDIILYMDDDDYYPPERISHAVETLQQNPKALCVGSSEMYIYFKHIQQMYQFGPYGPNHATAASFAFRKELLNITKYDENAALAEERVFLKDYTIPFAQLNPLKTILVFSHVHNSFDKKTLLDQTGNPYVKVSDKKIEDFVKEEDVKRFFLEEIDEKLNQYDFGKPENKPEVLKQIKEIAKKREDLIKQQQQQMMLQNQMIQQNQIAQNNEMTKMINDLTKENKELKEKIKYLENKISQLITEKIQSKKEELTKKDTISENIFNVKIINQ